MQNRISEKKVIPTKPSFKPGDLCHSKRTATGLPVFKQGENRIIGHVAPGEIVLHCGYERGVEINDIYSLVLTATGLFGVVETGFLKLGIPWTER